jgi:hypothetical protein
MLITMLLDREPIYETLKRRMLGSELGADWNPLLINATDKRILFVFDDNSANLATDRSAAF